MIKSKKIEDSKKDVPENQINKKSKVQKNGQLSKYKRILLNLHIDIGTEKKKVDEIIKEPDFIECLNIKSFQELTDFLHEFLEFFGYLGISERVIIELFDSIYQENPSEKLREFLIDRKRCVKLRMINGRYVKSKKLESVFPDKHKQLIDLKTKNLTELKSKTQKEKYKKKKFVRGKVKRSTKRGITDKLNNRDFKPENSISSKISIHTVKK